MNDILLNDLAHSRLEDLHRQAAGSRPGHDLATANPFHRALRVLFASHVHLTDHAGEDAAGRNPLGEWPDPAPA